MPLTVLAFVDLQLKNHDDWESVNNVREEGGLKTRKNHAEIHIVAIDGTFRQLFFESGALVRISGNTIWFDSDQTNYLITDHTKKFPNNAKIDDFEK